MSLEADFAFFQANEQSFLAQYPGQFIVISGQKVVGNYNERKAAYFESRSKYGMGNFII